MLALTYSGPFWQRVGFSATYGGLYMFFLSCLELCTYVIMFEFIHYFALLKFHICVVSHCSSLEIKHVITSLSGFMCVCTRGAQLILEQC